MREIKYKLNFQVYSQKAEVGPPLGTILGNLGVNTLRFTKEFNEFTQELPEYFKLRVSVNVYEDKSFVFSVEKPAIGFVLSLCKQYDVSGNCFINLNDLLQIAFFYMDHLPLENAIDVLLGSLEKNVSVEL